jgi:hypothetical protein
MSLTGNNILGGASGQTTGYDIDQSLRFNPADTPTMTHTPAGAGNRTTWTFSCWVKRCESTESGSTGAHVLLSSAVASGVTAGNTDIRFTETNDLLFQNYYYHSPNEYNYLIRTNAKYRDPGAWYHVVAVWDTSNGTADDRMRLYVNGEQVTSMQLRTNPSSSFESHMNSGTAFQVADYSATANTELNGYLAEVHFIDGTALTPASFGETNSDTNQWQAIKYAGSYGSNGFYLKFQDSSALGDDSSGNTNDFTATNLAATDQVLDSPTLNYSTLNPLINSSGTPAYSEGNLVITPDGSNYSVYQSTIPVSSGKWYAEYLVGDTNTFAGVSSADQSASAYGSYWDNTSADFIFFNNNNGNKIIDGAATSYVGAGATVGQIVGVAIDLDGNAINFYINNSAQGSISFSGGVASASSFVFSGVGYAADAERWNFGQDSSFAGAKTAQGNGGVGEDFYYTPPTGYKALNTDNLDDPAIALPTDHFNATLWTGDTSTYSDTRAITGVGHAPDLVWLKNRDYGSSHDLFDSVRGGNENLHSNTTDAQTTNIDGGWINSFDSDGFTLKIGGGGTSEWYDNLHDDKIVGWSWKAGGTASSNGDGDITSSVSANTTAGFSILTFSGDSDKTSTVGHGLSQSPELIIIKGTSSVQEWSVWHSSFPVDSVIYLNSTGAAGLGNNDGRFDVLPTASVFTPGEAQNTNATGVDYVTYCFHSVDGYSKVGSYTGANSTDSNFIYCGFKPAFVLLKNSGATEQWAMYDDKRNSFNLVDDRLRPNSSAAEDVHGGIDFVSNGFKIRSADISAPQNYIFYAVASSPFKTSNAR